ncbi:MAG: phytanoyl-CoA dioxygenase family protein [Halobacteriovoraceae bacterium]|nr:phytanoyl-CoA dioxygenase family protein [Halobacteriovoraceae bacterium]
MSVPFKMNLSKMKYLDRFFVHNLNPPTLSDFQSEKLKELRENGYCVLPNFIPDQQLAEIQADLDRRLKGHEYEMPCLGQSLIDESNSEHKRLKNAYFLSSLKEKTDLGMTFNEKDTEGKSFEEVLEKFRPSTLKLYIPPEDNKYSQIWFNEILLNIVESYMGIRPYCSEAYIRRNFPCDHKIMNHFWHRDRNHPDYLLKMFILFSDCEADNGPHQFVEKSHLDFEDTKPYYSEDEVETYCDQNSTKVVSSLFKAGTVILEDTRGLHRAAVPTKGFRDLGFAVFVPTTFWSKKMMNFYELTYENFNSLSPVQKSFVPDGVILE